MLLIFCLFGVAGLVSCAKDECEWKIKGETSQSSVFRDNGIEYTSNRAVDSNMSTCAHTSNQLSDWWNIDLMAIYDISSIKIYNTMEIHTDITGARIFIGSSRHENFTSNSLCNNITGFSEGEWNIINCTRSLLGRYVTVFTPKKFAVVCEVEICGSRQESPFELVSENKTWEDALNYCRDGDKDLASITDVHAQAWAELEAKKANTPFVWLALRYICILEFWLWVDNHSLNFTHWAANQIEDCDMSGAMETKDEHRWFSISDEKEYNFICAK
ncbi:uncharacterized protein V6R79_025676 [Siganus canaliculatus]